MVDEQQLEKIRRSHRSAKPKAENPAWLNTHNDLTVVLQAHDELERVLWQHGFVRCDIAACNCGSWHPRYGLTERFREISDALAEAGYLGNYNGNIALRGVQELIAKAGERDAQQANAGES